MTFPREDESLYNDLRDEEELLRHQEASEAEADADAEDKLSRDFLDERPHWEDNPHYVKSLPDVEAEVEPHELSPEEKAWHEEMEKGETTE